MIHILQREEIADRRYDATIRLAMNDTFFAYSWYLDKITESWLALVVDDYKEVMPIPYFSFLGRKFIYLPRLVPYLGLFGKNISFEDKAYQYLEYFLKKNKKYILLEYATNRFNKIQNFEKHFFPYLNLFEADEILDNINKNLLIKASQYKVYARIKFIEIKDFFYKNDYNKRLLNMFASLSFLGTLSRQLEFYGIYNSSGDVKALALIVITSEEISLIYWNSVENNEALFLALLKKIIETHFQKIKTFNILVDNLNIRKLMENGFRLHSSGYYYYVNKRLSKIYNFFKKYNFK